METLEEIKQKRSTKRFHVLKELINTERDFLNDTNITIDDIMIPLSEHEVYMTWLDAEAKFKIC